MAGLYWQGLWRVSLGERQLLLRSTLTGSLTFIGSVIAMWVKYLSAWDKCWGLGDQVTIRHHGICGLIIRLQKAEGYRHQTGGIL